MVADPLAEPLDPLPAETVQPPTLHDRLGALFEVVVCSGFPSQLLLILLFSLVGLAPADDAGGLSLSYLVLLSLVDAGLVLGLVWVFLRAHGERPAALFLGVRRPLREAALGLLLMPIALALAALTFGVILQIAPTLRNVPENPLEALILAPGGLFWFAVVSVVAGGLREEIQRAFILHRFEQRLGGALVGLVVFSAAFGLGHLVQGRDAVVVTALLGGFWGIIFLLRRSVVAPVVCHAAFNLTEIAIAYATSG